MTHGTLARVREYTWTPHVLQVHDSVVWHLFDVWRGRWSAVLALSIATVQRSVSCL